MGNIVCPVFCWRGAITYGKCTRCRTECKCNFFWIFWVVKVNKECLNNNNKNKPNVIPISGVWYLDVNPAVVKRRRYMDCFWQTLDSIEMYLMQFYKGIRQPSGMIENKCSNKLQYTSKNKKICDDCRITKKEKRRRGLDPCSLSQNLTKVTTLSYLLASCTNSQPHCLSIV